MTDREGAIVMFHDAQANLVNVENVLVDGG